MRFKSLFKLSLAASIAVCANGADESVLSGVEVTSSSGGYGVDDIKISTRNAGLVKDVMRDIPGVYVGGTNGMNQKIYMRGVSDRGLNITIDGAKQNGNTFHHNADLLIDPDLIKAVDVEVGSRSVVNGSGALGGSVAFKTVDAKDLLESGEIIGAKIKTGYASNNSEFSQGLMLFTAPVEGLDFIAAINHKGYDYGKSGNKRKIGGDGNDLSYLLKLGYSFLDAHRISISREHNEFKGMYPMRAEFGSWYSDSNAVDNRKYERDTTTLKYEYKPSDLLNLDVTVYNTEHKKDDPVLKILGVKTNGINAKAKSVVETGALTQTFRYGAEFYQSKNFNKPNNHYPEKVNNYSIYAEDALNFSSLTVTPGIRYTRHELKSYDGRAGNVKSYTYKFNEFTPALALDYEILKGLNAFASYARVFRGPDVMESMMAGGSRSWEANKDLKPTTGNSYETGLKYQGDISEASSYSLSAKYFMTKYKNLIVDNNAAGGRTNPIMIRKNAGGADISGVELLARLNLDALSLAASYTHQNVKYKDRVAKASGGYYTSNIIGYRDQGDKYTFNAEYAFSSIDTLIGYNLIYFASKNTISAGDNETTKIPSYAVSDIYASYTPSSGKFKGLEINAGIYNLFNKTYASQSQRMADYTGNPNYVDWEPGRNFKVNISYKF
ncbi:TonB-dependent receptor [Campylobacter concisus]|uniref:TonB-dependent receptor domain-containing protein n=1 Tax=Campylobacter concisus TaxID=199 RepID=UPI0018A9E897|nr:TonB-dependent receptor [Campylobacter concisus]QPH99895.1 TonB-dependent receptor [Campylobacter concisus]QPI01687.1 TonB-dependent receptor [Campylobacter concisus]